MGRRFASASNERIYIGSSGLGGLNYLYGSFACVINFVSLPTFGTILATNQESGACFTIYHNNTTLRTYDGTTERDGPTVTTGVTYLIAFTKATGTATGRFHVYRFNTGAWTHTAAAGTTVNSATNTSIGIGTYADSASDPVDAEMWAIALWPNVVMTDSEVERLAGGRWLESSPGFYAQFSDSAEIGDMVSTLGRYRTRQTARTGTTRGAQTPPPGFRFGPVRRRR